MKRVWFAVITAATVFAGGAFAEPEKGNGMDTDGDGKVSKAEYIESRRKISERKGEEFNQKSAEKKFAGRDKDGDGFLNGAEMVKQKKPKKEKQEETGDSEE